MKQRRNLLALVSCMLLMALLLAGCGKSYEEQLAGSWYREGSASPIFTLYSDGTCEIKGEYGTGTWAVVNDDQLKLTNFYGEAETVTIISISNGCLTIGDGGDNTVELWDSPQ